MARFSFGEEEEEENEMESRANNKRKGQSPTEGGNQNKSQKSAGDAEQLRSGIEDKMGGISVTIDPDALDCFICCEPLRPPLYQCVNGHVACRACSIKLPQNKCPNCSQAIDFTRCRFLEKIIESIKSPCCYSEHGCNKTLSYPEIFSHQETCVHAPCFCPIPKCTFSGTPEKISTHFRSHHESSAIDFQYGKQFKASLAKSEPYIVLPSENGLLFLLLNDKHDKGNNLSVACIRPGGSTGSDFVYELMVSNAESSLQLKASAINVRKWEGVYPSKVFLLVPQNFCSSYVDIVLNVCIKSG
ncbi:uncharacterized protein A4U43_C01F29240 [Asparagus officinalis]|uniref:RING-type E3 ubiquitin transferase n=1 Tax=Asparagus officinalis TaxID=4686 RepID=A0A5P1FTN5_ASPOF|nr:E3 ubiquitin-protein ligase SINA-like 10 [Asparagus officinalis]ONK81452.1 uncharacterized protein A4U43_C01F29240 [Asparagus officinalis]